LKIATFNINNINKRLHNLTAWLVREQPDVVCLQELKVEQREFPASTLRDLGYGGVWLGERSWNGVAILTRDCDPVLTRSSLPGNPDDRQARYVEAAVNGVLIASIYLPNGNPQPGPKFDYKLAWFQRLIDHGAELMKAGVPVILAGDYNVVPAAQDIYPTRSLDKNALIQPQPPGLCPPAIPGLDRRSAKTSTRGAALDVLGLRAQSMASRQGDAPGSFPSLSDGVRAAGRRGRGPVGSRRGKRERPRSRVDSA
jgi:hypothetical protein